MKVYRAMAVISALFFLSCSGFDFFGYENNTGLYAIKRPQGYASAKLGIEMTPTSTANLDLLGASGGAGTGTLVFKLAEDGSLKNVSDPWDSHMAKSSQEENRLKTDTGASLAGLPSWAGRESGCVAVGEPNFNQVILRCASDLGKEKPLKLVAGSSGGNLTEFGRNVAAIRPENGGAWLLAVAAKRRTWVISDERDAPSNSTEPFIAETASNAEVGDVENIAGGRRDDRFFVATLVSVKGSGPRVYVFVQDAGNAKKATQTLCLEQPEESRFSGALATGDIDDNGADELIVSAGLSEKGKKKVYIYDIDQLISASSDPGLSTCDGAIQQPRIALEPEEGDLDVECGDLCNFGAALAVGDISTEDSYPEIAVGAPEAKVDGTKDAGAVYIYSVTDFAAGEAELSSQVAHSSPARGHWFGGGLAIVPVAGRNELVIATTGKGNLYVAFCTGVGEDIRKGGDVPTNASGSVVSTKCRQ